MTKIIQEVRTDFAKSVALIDVNICDDESGNRLRRADTRAIPTLVFVDRGGQAQGYIDVMEPDALHERLWRKINYVQSED